MTVERKSADTIHGLSPEDTERFLDRDSLIRQGMCPNGCGLMELKQGIQSCPHCGFSTNVQPEQEAAN